MQTSLALLAEQLRLPRDCAVAAAHRLGALQAFVMVVCLCSHGSRMCTCACMCVYVCVCVWARVSAAAAGAPSPQTAHSHIGLTPGVCRSKDCSQVIVQRAHAGPLPSTRSAQRILPQRHTCRSRCGGHTLGHWPLPTPCAQSTVQSSIIPAGHGGRPDVALDGGKLGAGGGEGVSVRAEQGWGQQRSAV